jgi:polyhydroxybutyrate depolymerase
MSLVISLAFLPLLLQSTGCQPEPASHATRENIAGSYPRTLTTPDGLERRFIVYVPPSAEGKDAVPALFVVHGTNQTGRVFHDNPNLWNAKADEEGFIVVYPTALSYCHYDQGEERTTTKWADGDLGETEVERGALPLCPGEVLADDVLFFDTLVETINEDYAVDERRLYVSGFSNGAQMASRLAAERSEVFAAVAPHAGSLSAFVPAVLASRPMSMMVTVGANDALFASAVGMSTPVPVNEDLPNNAGVTGVLQPFLDLNGLDFQYSYSSAQYLGRTIADFRFERSNVGLNNSVRFVLVEDLGHSYTELLIDPLWDFFENHSLPSYG